MRELVTFVRRDPAAELLVVTNMWPVEGRPAYGIFVKRQVDSIAKSGVRCDVLFVRGHESPLAYAKAVLMLALWTLRPKRRYRLVHAQGGETGVAARAYFRAPLVVSYGGSDLLGAPDAEGHLSPSWRIRSRVIRALSVLNRASITKTRELEQALPARARRRNAVIPNGIDRQVFSPQERGAARARLGWGLDERLALFAADPAAPLKRYELAVDACRYAEQQLGEIRLVVAKGIPPEEMPTLMSAAGCLLHTSRSEGSPNVVKEALACDLPVVATRVGDVPELLDGVTDSYVCDDTPEALGRALANVLDRPRRSNGRERSAWLAQEAVAGRILAHYELAGWGHGRSPVQAEADPDPPLTVAGSDH